MLSAILAITMLVQPAPGAPDLSTPQAAAQAFGSAALAGDAASARLAVPDNEASRKFVARLVAAAAAHKNLEKVSQATLHRFPEVDNGILQELRTFPTYAAKGMWDIKGDQARWLLDKSADPGVRITATRADGKWKVNPESMNMGLAATQGEDLEAFTTACNKVAADIQAGKIHNVVEIHGAHRRYTLLALEQAAKAAPTAPFAIDCSTPESALRGALVAEEISDHQALLKAVDPRDSARPMLAALVEASKAHDALRDALLQRFGDAAEGFGGRSSPQDPQQRARVWQEVEKYKVVVNGDEARFEGRDWPVVHKDAAGWRVAVAAHFAQEKEGIDLRIAEGKLAKEMLAEVNAGRYNSFADFQVAMAGKFQAIYSKMTESRAN